MGCGTGRFAEALAERLRAKVLGIDPSAKMLSVARDEIDNPRVRLVRGAAEGLPLAREAVDIVFLSMVYHHIVGKADAALEFARVLKREGRLVMRTSTRELLPTYLWGRFFERGLEIDAARAPSRDEIAEVMGGAGMKLVTHRIVPHPFADDLTDYAGKIGMRALSPLQQISDEGFEEGMRRLRDHCREHDDGQPVSEDIELWVWEPGPQR